MKKPIIIITLFSLLFFSSSSFAQIDTVANLSDADKLYGLSKFWEETSYNFAYFDHAHINWDSTYRAYIPKILATKSTWQYYLVMEQFCALLKDGHTSVGVPLELFTHRSRNKWLLLENSTSDFM